MSSRETRRAAALLWYASIPPPSIEATSPGRLPRKLSGSASTSSRAQTLSLLKMRAELMTKADVTEVIEGKAEGVPNEWAPNQIEFEDLGAVLDGGLEAPPLLVESLLVSGQVNWLSGHPENGKTTVALWAALKHIRNGGHVIWLDWEGGPRQTLLRLQALSATRDEIVGHFHYAYAPLIPADGEAREMLTPLLSQWPDALVVFDSCSKALSVAGIDENDNTESTRWTTRVVMPLRGLGATVLVIDHVAKSATASNPYPRGAGAKLADTEVAWYVQKTEDFNQRASGEITLKCQKDRNGILPLKVQLSVGDGEGGLPIKVKNTSDVSEGKADGYGAVLGRTREAIKKHSGPDKKLSTRQLRQLVRGKNASVERAAKQLADEWYEPVQVEATNSAVVYWWDESAAPKLPFSDAETGFASREP